MEFSPHKQQIEGKKLVKSEDDEYEWAISFKNLEMQLCLYDLANWS